MTRSEHHWSEYQWHTDPDLAALMVAQLEPRSFVDMETPDA